MSMKEKYLEEYEKYKHIVITEGEYRLKDTAYHMRVEDIREEDAQVTNLKTGTCKRRTLHWCRKNLEKL